MMVDTGEENQGGGWCDKGPGKKKKSKEKSDSLTLAHSTRNEERKQ